MMTEEKTETVDLRKVLASINRKLNKEKTISYDLTQDNPAYVTQWISTGSTVLDYCISNQRNGGIPVGKISEISGFSKTGKSLIAYHLIKNIQAMGGVAYLIDTEYALTTDFMERQGVDTSLMSYINTSTIEETFETIEKIIIEIRIKTSKEVPVLIVWDSVAATKPQAEVEGNYDPQSRMGLAGKAMALGWRKLTEAVKIENVTLVLTNQCKMKPGLGKFVDPIYTPGGFATEYHASAMVRLSLSGGNLKNSSGDVIGQKVRALVIKTRFGPPLRDARFYNMTDHGPDDVQSIYEFLHEVEEIKKAAGWSTLVVDGVDVKFQHSKWKEKYNDPKIKEYVHNLLDKHLIKKFDPVDAVVIDPKDADAIMVGDE